METGNKCMCTPTVVHLCTTVTNKLFVLEIYRLKKILLSCRMINQCTNVIDNVELLLLVK